MPYTIRTHAKINLSLLVFPPQSDTYHPICSIFQTLSLYDTLTIQPQTEKNCVITSNKADLPTDTSNILTKLYLSLQTQLPDGFRIHIEKHIPMGGGMGGGSSNAAGFLLYLNHHYLKLSLPDLITLAKPLGADIPFFLVGGTALVTGIGENIRPLATLVDKHYLLITPPIHCSTADIFTAFDARPYLYKTIIPPPPTLLRHHLGENSLRTTVFNLYPEFKDLEKWVIKHKKDLYMSGSGATTFIPFESLSDCKDFYEKVIQAFPTYTVHCTYPVSGAAIHMDTQ
jgi:4-diphosphocytidyl-2-C-methyl-D-erythritol kinase